MERITAAVAGFSLLLAACGGTADTTTTSAPLVATTTTAASTTTTPVITQPTTSTVAFLSCDEYYELADPLRDRAEEDTLLMGDAVTQFFDGSMSADEAAAVLLSGSESLAEIEEEWRNIGPLLPEFQTSHEPMLQAFGKLVEASTLQAEAISTDAVPLFDESNELGSEAFALIEQALEASPNCAALGRTTVEATTTYDGNKSVYEGPPELDIDSVAVFTFINTSGTDDVAFSVQSVPDGTKAGEILENGIDEVAGEDGGPIELAFVRFPTSNPQIAELTVTFDQVGRYALVFSDLATGKDHANLFDVTDR